MSKVTVRAPAKINIGLEILGRRDDGFHEIRTIMQTVSIFDRLTLTPAPSVEVSCSVPALATDTNLAARAAYSVRERYRVRSGVRIALDKSIPTAAGLGGASSDAAAALRGTCALWSPNCSPIELEALATHLGSDVPFFLRGGTMLAEGRGERLTSLPPLADVWFVVAAPRIEIPSKTPTMYASLQPDDFSDGAMVRMVANTLKADKPVEWSGVVNRFESVATRLIPEIERVRAAFRRAGAFFVSMTGAGPSHYTATDDQERAESLHARLTCEIGTWAELFVCQPTAAVPPVERN